jgi:hypothetical protein
MSLWAVAVILLIADESSCRLAQALQRRLLMNVAQLANVIGRRANAFGLAATGETARRKARTKQANIRQAWKIAAQYRENGVPGKKCA